MSGLSDQDLKEKVLTQAMLNNVKDLPSLLTMLLQRNLLVQNQVSMIIPASVVCGDSGLIVIKISPKTVGIVASLCIVTIIKTGHPSVKFMGNSVL